MTIRGGSSPPLTSTSTSTSRRRSSNNNNRSHASCSSGGNGIGIDSDEGWTSCNSAGAREAMSILIQSHDAISMIPGPFVVMQGTPGDGMANTIDSMPQLIVDDANDNIDVSANRTSNINSHQAELGIERDRGRRSTANPSAEGNGDDGTNESSNISIPSDLPNEIPHLSSATGSANSSHITIGLGSSSQSNSNENIGGGGGGGVSVNIESHGSDGEIVCMADSMTSDLSSLEVMNADGGNVTSSTADIGTPRASNVDSNQCFQNRTQMDRGLHLPLPASAVSVAAMGMVYNSFLPPVASASPGIKSNEVAESKMASKPMSAVPDTNTTNVVLSDSFIMVDDEKDGSDSAEKPLAPSMEHENGNEHEHDHTSIIDDNIININDEVESLQTESSNIDIGKCTSSAKNPRYANISSQDRRAIQQWKVSCRKEEKNQQLEMIDNTSASSAGNTNSYTVENQWWTTKNGCLAVFETLPILSAKSEKASESNHQQNNNSIITTCLGNQIQIGNISGEIPPGTTVMAIEMHCIDENLLESSFVESMRTSKFANKFQLLKIESPITGYVVYSSNGYCYLGPGLPTYYVEPEVWMWRVMCASGAFVRQGLELTSVHIETVPFGSLLRVSRKTVNSMGLSRVQIESSVSVASKSSADANSMQLVSRLRNRARNMNPPSTFLNSSSEQHGNIFRRVSGWVSEALNPLSGQRGSIVQPIPFPVPVLYRVTLTDGAVIRSGVELSSPQIGHAPIGSILTIVGRAYSEHPADRCIERLKLAGAGGWISVRLNRAPPRDYLVVEMTGIDGSFDPNEAGLYHIEKQRQVIQECHEAPSNAEGQNMENLRQSLHRLSTISSINDDDDDQGGNLENSGELSNTCSSMTSAAVPTLYRSGVATGSVGSQSIKACGSSTQKDERCLICLTESRTATIVHGETGHIACCLICARILKARGDKVSSILPNTALFLLLSKY